MPQALGEIKSSQANDADVMSQRSHSSQHSESSQGSRSTHRQEERNCARQHQDLAEHIEQKRVALVNPRNNELQQRLKQANELLEDVPEGSTRELNRNFQLFNNMAGLALEQARLGEKNNSKFTADTLVEKLVARYFADDDYGEEEDEDARATRFQHVRGKFEWSVLARDSFGMFAAAPTVNFMTGPMRLQPKERKQTQARKRSSIGVKITPDSVRDTNEESEEHTHLMNELKGEIEQSGSYQLFWPYVLQKDLGSTVLKIFACCFLARENHFVVRLNTKMSGSERLLCPGEPEGELILGPRQLAAAAEAAAPDGDKPNLQFIMSLDMKEYKQKCAQYGVYTGQDSGRPTKAARS